MKQRIDRTKTKMHNHILGYSSIISILQADSREYIFVAQNDLREAQEFIGCLRRFKPFVNDVRKASNTQKAINLAVIVSYSRIFKYSRGFQTGLIIAKEFTLKFTTIQSKLHEKLLKLRDTQFAHSDSSALDVQFYSRGIFNASHRVVRELLSKKELVILSRMVTNIIKHASLFENEIYKISICHLK